MQYLKTLGANSPKISKDWDILCFLSFIKLRRDWKSVDKLHSAVQEIIISEDKNEKNCTLIFSAHDQIAEGNLVDLKVKHLHELIHKNLIINSIVLACEILENIISIEKERSMIEVPERKF